MTNNGQERVLRSRKGTTSQSENAENNPIGSSRNLSKEIYALQKEIQSLKRQLNKTQKSLVLEQETNEILKGTVEKVNEEINCGMCLETCWRPFV